MRFRSRFSPAVSYPIILISPCRAHHRLSFKGLVFAKKATVTASPSLPLSFSAVWIILLVCKFWCEGMHHFNIQNAPTSSTLVILKKSFVSFICESLIHVIVISKLLTVGTRTYLLLKAWICCSTHVLKLDLSSPLTPQTPYFPGFPKLTLYLS